MYHGGTTWGRWTGGPQDTTSYESAPQPLANPFLFPTPTPPFFHLIRSPFLIAPVPAMFLLSATTPSWTSTGTRLLPLPSPSLCSAFSTPLTLPLPFPRSLLVSYPHNPKFSHTATLHSILSKYAPYILGNPIANATVVNPDVDVRPYGDSNGGLVFLSNISPSRSYPLSYGGKSFTLPEWSVTLVDLQSLQVVYCTAVIAPSAPELPSPDHRHTRETPVVEAPKARAIPAADDISYIQEPIGLSLSTVNKSTSPLEQFSLTADATDFLWYTTSYAVTARDVEMGYLNLTLTDTNEFVYVYFNAQPVLRGFARNVGGRGEMFVIPIKGLAAGSYQLQLLVVTMGLQNCCQLFHTPPPFPSTAASPPPSHSLSLSPCPVVSSCLCSGGGLEGFTPRAGGSSGG